MIYRTYIEKSKGYKSLCTGDLEKTIQVLDYLILEKQTNNKILVIEHDKKLNQDFPVFLHPTEEYGEFKNNSKQKIKR